MAFNKIYWIGALLLAGSLAFGWHVHVVGSLEESLARETERAEKAETALATALEAKAKLETAVAGLESAVSAAQQKRTVVYREVQKEVAKDEASRDWYNAPLPAGIRGLLKKSAGAGDR